MTTLPPVAKAIWISRESETFYKVANGTLFQKHTVHNLSLNCYNEYFIPESISFKKCPKLSCSVEKYVIH